MKYSSTNKPTVCMMTNSTCYKGTRTMTIKGVLWHSTGANNTSLKRYVQPSSNDANYSKLISLLGKNTNANDWNHAYRDAGVNAWIGKTAAGDVTSVQTLPWNYRPWGCASGSKGSCNDHWIQFEICEDALTNKDYFNKVYKEACELTAYLCKTYNLDPKGKVSYNGVSVPVILCHWDSYKLNLGSGHSDVYHWFNKYGKTMDDVRNDVAALIKGSTTTTTTSTPTASTSTKPTTTVTSSAPAGVVTTGTAVNYSVKVTPSDGLNCRKGPSTSYSVIKAYSKDTVLKITKESGSWGFTGEGWISLAYTTKVSTGATTAAPAVQQSSFFVKVTASVLNIRKGPGTSYAIAGTIEDKGKYTIVETSGNWGKLKSGAGWICLDYTQRVS